MQRFYWPYYIYSLQTNVNVCRSIPAFNSVLHSEKQEGLGIKSHE